MDPQEIRPSSTGPAGAQPAGGCGIRSFFWDGRRLIPRSPDARASCHAAHVAGDASDEAGWPGGVVVPNGDELVHELERDGGALIEYWVPVGDEMVPATPEQAERFRGYDRELIASYRLEQWLREEQHRTSWPLPQRLFRALSVCVAGSARRLRALAPGGGRTFRDLDGAHRGTRPVQPPPEGRQHSQP